jgi:P27 family predicted phage terminase small subunit
MEPKNRKSGHVMTFEAIDGGSGTPEQPAWQLLFSGADECGAAAAYWSTIVATMRAAETLSVANGHAIKRLVLAAIVYDRASAAVARDGAVRRVKGVHRKNPQWMLMKQSAEMCAGIEAELGLSPAKRGRVGKVTRTSRKRPPANEYLRSVE